VSYWEIQNGFMSIFRVLMHLRRSYLAEFGLFEARSSLLFLLSLTHGANYPFKSVLVYTPAVSI